MPAGAGARVALALLALAAVPGVAAELSQAGVPGLAATHPYSVLPYGSSRFYSDLTDSWNAEAGDVSAALGADAVLVVAPDEAFTDSEAAALAERLTRGGYGVLIADETSAGAGLARRLAGVVLSEHYMMNPDVRPGAGAVAYAVEVYCSIGGRDFRVYFVKAVYIESYPEWMEPVCVAPRARTPGGGGPVVAAVYGEVNGSRVLVVSDSSIFANFMYEGLPGYPPTRGLALAMVEAVAPKGSRVVYDVGHLSESRASIIARTALLALSAPAWAAGAAREALAGSAAWAALAAAVPAILALRPPARQGPRAGRPLAVYLARECIRLQRRGCPDWLRGPEPGPREAERLAARLGVLASWDSRGYQGSSMRYRRS